MSKERFIQHDSWLGKNFGIEKKEKSGKLDIIVWKDGDLSGEHDHGWINHDTGGWGYEDRGISKKEK